MQKNKKDSYLNGQVKEKDDQQLEFDTLKDTSECLKSSILKLIHEVEDRITLINGDLIEPLNMYIQHYSTTTDAEFDKLE